MPPNTISLQSYTIYGVGDARKPMFDRLVFFKVLSFSMTCLVLAKEQATKWHYHYQTISNYTIPGTDGTEALSFVPASHSAPAVQLRSRVARHASMRDSEGNKAWNTVEPFS